MTTKPPTSCDHHAVTGPDPHCDACKLELLSERLGAILFWLLISGWGAVMLWFLYSAGRALGMSLH